MSGWESVREFTVGSVELPETRTRKRSTWGPKAIRVPQRGKNDRVLAACAYVGPAQSLYLDARLTQPLCAVVASGENSWAVRDAGGTAIGTITRLPSSRPLLLRPNWRIEQPGHPEVIGRTEWLGGDVKQFAEKAAGRLFGGVLDALTNFGADGGDQPTKERVLEWRAGDDIVMLSEATKSITIKSPWLDRRLAFAYALLAE